MSERLEIWAKLVEETRARGTELRFYGPQTLAAITMLEVSLQAKFPPSFREFLEIYGGGGGVGGGISGIWENTPLTTNEGTVYGDTVRTREQFGLPKHLIVVYRNFMETIYCLDMSRADANGENPVVFFDFENYQPGDDIAPSFDEHFREYLSSC